MVWSRQAKAEWEKRAEEKDQVGAEGRKNKEAAKKQAAKQSEQTQHCRAPQFPLTFGGFIAISPAEAGWEIGGKHGVSHVLHLIRKRYCFVKVQCLPRA